MAQTYKGAFYVLITTTLVYSLVNSYNKRQKRLRDDLREKEKKAQNTAEANAVLLREVHHRVKNNLQIINSMIHLSIDQEKLSSSRIMINLTSRIGAISFVHDFLYDNPSDEANISVPQYFHTLVMNSINLHNPHGINVIEKVENISFSLDKIISCGLILNEVMNNALEHAFPQEKGGTIIVTLRNKGIETLMQIEDNGIGFEAESLGESLGYSLIESLVQKVNGSYNILSEPGKTTFNLTFRAP